MLPVVAPWTYDQQQVVTVDGGQYVVPDQLFYTQDSGGESRNDIQLLNSVSEYFSSYWSSTSVYASAAIDGVNLKFAFGHTQYTSKYMFANNTANFALNDNIQKKFSLEFFPGFDLHPVFVKMIKALPQQYDATKYGNIIKGWGTHYISGAQYGSKWNFTTIFNTSVYLNRSVDWVKNQVGISIGYNAYSFGLNYSNYANHTKMDSAFAENSYTDHTVIGGDINVFNTQGYEAWLPTLETDWGLVLPMSTIDPIYELVDDPVIAANLKKAIIFYGNNGYIENDAKSFPKEWNL